MPLVYMYKRLSDELMDSDTDLGSGLGLDSNFMASSRLTLCSTMLLMVKEELLVLEISLPELE